MPHASPETNRMNRCESEAILVDIRSNRSVAQLSCYYMYEEPRYSDSHHARIEHELCSACGSKQPPHSSGEMRMQTPTRSSYGYLLRNALIWRLVEVNTCCLLGCGCGTADAALLLRSATLRAIPPTYCLDSWIPRFLASFPWCYLLLQ